ncbi:galactose oxidase [Colletotrichum orchidophilum]|uniref:Galactose oxidase n=1 Tax=Colletotrichum orchidophilum TaxID=1209926 RepID=A0A1G4BGH7_9PEZI|nr:galactose oxidase [Colletotrichum orchidophilum]OHF00491.1 galactose oxidase [Colletotrichum orchidophilum]
MQLSTRALSLVALVLPLLTSAQDTHDTLNVYQMPADEPAPSGQVHLGCYQERTRATALIVTDQPAATDVPTSQGTRSDNMSPTTCTSYRSQFKSNMYSLSRGGTNYVNAYGPGTMMTAAASPSKAQHIGCQRMPTRGDPLAEHAKLHSSQMTVQWCQDHCGLYQSKYFSLRGDGRDCSCGDAPSDRGTSGSSFCKTACTGDKDAFCGGGTGTAGYYNLGNAGPFPEMYTSIYNPSIKEVTEALVENTQQDMFCPGISMDADGHIIVSGGSTAAKTSIFDEDSNSWAATGEMEIPRGHQSSTLTSDNKVFTIGGSFRGGCIPVVLCETIATRGFMRGKTDTFSRPALGAGNRGSDNDAMCGVNVMYEAVAGKILIIGGAPRYDGVASTANAHVLPIGEAGGAVEVEKLENAELNRGFANGVILPDGKVFIIGGQSRTVLFSGANPQLFPEIWDPATKDFTEVKPLTTPRNYHSDGQTLAKRPVVSELSVSDCKAGNSITITMEEAANCTFPMIRMGTSTHAVNTDQRHCPLEAQTNNNQYAVTVPSDAGIALPGYWMLFAVNEAGVPGVAKNFRVAV